MNLEIWKRRVRAALLVLLAAAAALWAGPLRADRENLVIGLTQYPATLNPITESMAATSYVTAMGTRPLTTYDATWQLACLLCLEVPTLENGLAERRTLDNGTEGIAVTYKIHPEAVWGDGTPVTADDFVLTWRIARHPDTGVPSAEGFLRILDIEVADPKTFTLVVDRVTFNYNSAQGFFPIPAHLEQAIFEASPIDYRRQTLYQREPENPGLWLGPYVVERVDPGTRIVMKRNQAWWGEAPAFERVVVRTIQNTSALEANLRSGEIDMIAGELSLSVTQALPLVDRLPGHRIVFKESLVYEHIDLKLDNPILADRRVRHALVSAIDRGLLVDRLFAGEQPVANSNVSPLDWVYDESVEKYAYDQALAVALLEEAGWTEGPDGVRVNDAGERLTLEFLTTAGDRTRELVQQVIQSAWAEVGVEAVIRNAPARIMFGELVTKREYQALAMFAWIKAPESVPRTTLYSTEIPTAENNWTGQNYTGLQDEKTDELIDAIEVELDAEKRKALWAKLQERYVELLPAIPLYWRANPFILPTWLEGLEPTGQLAPTTYWIEDWKVAETE